ncbi:prolipoprotein diacylglyceryl transferase [Candidatus Woesearchaeota archaeon]|nr:prolipoprotein diacylglyceryl transferase [Candidatus Woesearchaeota archaeon]
MFYHNIDPVLVNLGPLQIRYYGLVYVFGILVAYVMLRSLSKKQEIKNITEENLLDFMIYLTLAVIVGGRLGFFLFYNLGSFLENPLELFYLWHGGMSFHGALIGVAIAGYLFCRKYKVDFYELADILVIPAALALAFGRIANFINAELIGTVTTVPWCVQYQGVEGCRHPSQLYESLKNLFIFGILFWTWKSKNLPKGLRFWLFIWLYGVLRFITNFWRDDPRILFGISTGQYFSLVMAIVATVFIYKISTRSQR